MTHHAPLEITSAANERYRRLLELAGSPRERLRSGLIVLEGAHLLQAWIERFGANAESIELFIPKSASTKPENAALLTRFGTRAVVLDDRLFARASGVERGAGPLAIVRHAPEPLPARLDEDAVYLDRLQDPGNVGSVLRSCAAVGVRVVLCSPQTAACWSPKVLRAAMGAHFHLSIHEGVDAAQLHKRRAVPAIATDAAGTRSIYDADLRAPAVWLLGNEGRGLDPALLEAPDTHRISIPQSPRVESLNVGVAAALCLYEQWRQRGFPGRSTGHRVREESS